MYQVFFFVPEDHKEKVKEACFAAGAGRFDSYDCCAWECKGYGQFRPLEGSNAFIGSMNTLEGLEEYRVEFICSGEDLNAVLEALVAAHPYETPAYGAYKITTLN